jgi:hypothetical protein
VRTPKSRISDGKKTADNAPEYPRRGEKGREASERREKNGSRNADTVVNPVPRISCKIL